MINFYSQGGEDVILNELFEGQGDGFFVEVGCIDGRRFSNTLTFEERGWKGLLVEAHSGYMDLLRENRPNSIVCHCAAGEKDEDDVIFFANSRGSLSTLDKSRESQFKRRYKQFFTGFEEQRVSKARLDTLFKKHNVKEIDILSLDIEGYEVEAMRGLDLGIYRPRVLLIESDSPRHERSLDNLIIPFGYSKSVKIGGNIFYLIDASMKRKIENRKFEPVLIHTQHPMDKCGDTRLKIRIDTAKYRRREIRQRIKRRILSLVNFSR